MDSPSVRPAAHAGSFYPADPNRLERQVRDQLLTAAMGRVAAEPIRGEIVGLLVPHAGLVHSGPVAARAWEALAAATPAPTSVVVAGTNHYLPGLDAIVVWDDGPWHVPLGEQPIDAPLARLVAGLGPPFVASRPAHLADHSIEVQVPFLLTALPGTPFVPILPGGLAPDRLIEAGRRLGSLLAERRPAGERVAVVASSDLAHYPRDAVARELDERTLEPILALDPEELVRRETGVRLGDVPGADCGLCGLEPVLVTMAAVHALGAERGILLAHSTSADSPGGDPRRVVGYAAVAFVR